MRVLERTDITEEDNLGGETVEMTLDESSLAFIMSTLTDLYSDPTLAVIREYSTNAWDAHQAAGNDAPIEVTLPTHFNPVFTVQDHGIGMSLADLKEVFSKYGASTKRNTDAQAGMLGLGCKSALTYTEQFTVVAVKDGRKTVVAVSRDAKGGGSLRIVAEHDTEDADGVRIEVPVKNVDVFISKANNFYRYWNAGSVLVNGQPNESIFDTESDERFLRLHDNLLLDKNNMGSYVVQGNVPYPVDPGYDLGAGKGSVIARVPIGSVSFPPARESLTYDSRTKEVLAGLKDFVRTTLDKVIRAEIAKRTDPYEAMRFAWENQDLIKNPETLTFGPDDLPWPFETSLVTTAEGEQDGLSFRPNAGPRHQTSNAPRVRLQRPIDLRSLLFVTNYGNKTFNAIHKAKVIQGMDYHTLRDALKGEVGGYYNDFPVYIVDDVPKNLLPWLEHFGGRVFDWNELKSITLQRKTGDGSKTKRRGTPYDVLDAAGEVTEFYIDDIIDYATTYDVRVVVIDNLTLNSYRVMEFIGQDEYVVRMAKNRVPKFRRELKEAKAEVVSLREVIMERYSAAVNNLTQADLDSLASGSSFSYYDDVNKWRGVVDTGIEDPDLVQFFADIEAYNKRGETPTKAAKAYVEALTAASYAEVHVAPVSTPDDAVKKEKDRLNREATRLLKRYPLQEHITGSISSQAARIEYYNLKFKSLQKENEDV